MDDEWSQLPIDPNTGVKVIDIGGSNPLPVQPSAGTSDDTDTPAFGATDVGTATSQADVETGPLAKLFGLSGNERYKTWPEKLIESAVTAPADALAGKITPDQEIPRALDMASLAGVGPLAIAPGEATLGSGMVRMATNDVVPVFYSAVENAVKNAKLNVGTADQWLGYLKNQPGVKQEELDWTLGDLPTGKLTKDDVQAHVDANKVQVSDVTKGEDAPLYKTQYKDTFPRSLEGFTDLPIGNADDVMLAIKHNPQFKETVKGKSPVEILDALDEARDLPNLDNVAGKYFDSQEEAEAAIKAAGGENHLEVSQIAGKNKETKFSSYQLPGGTNYQEKLLTLPNKKLQTAEAYAQDFYNNTKGEGGRNWEQLSKYEQQDWINAAEQQQDFGKSPGNFKSSHWDEPNVLAHVRMNDRNVEGNKTLHLEEIQSDWHQKGRVEGYKITDAQKQQLEALDNKLISGLSEADIGNPDMNAVLQTAQDKGILTAQEAKNYADWSKGKNSSIPNAPFKTTWADLALKRMIRHAAENGYDAISWTPGEAQAARYDLSKHISEVHYSGSNLKAYDHNGNTVINTTGVRQQDLPDYIGKEAAQKLLDQPIKNGTLRSLVGQDLKIGGEGMKAFYDKMLVDKANNIAKKYGKVEDKNIEPSDTGYVDRKGNQLDEKGNILNSQPIKFLKLPQELKDTALQKGFPLFSGGYSITPVANNPFQENVEVNGKTIPINNKQDVPDLAGASNNSDTVNVDKSVPRFDPKFKLKNGQSGDIYKYLAIHENTEKEGMEKDIADFKQSNGREPNAEEMHRIYLNNHYGRATPAEHAAIIADGGNPKDYEDVLHGYEKNTEHETHADVPQNLYRKVYSHSQLRKMTLQKVEGNPFDGN